MGDPCPQPEYPYFEVTLDPGADERDTAPTA
jgi:hypothetical protein